MACHTIRNMFLTSLCRADGAPHSIDTLPTALPWANLPVRLRRVECGGDKTGSLGPSLADGLRCGSFLVTMFRVRQFVPFRTTMFQVSRINSFQMNNSRRRRYGLILYGRYSSMFDSVSFLGDDVPWRHSQRRTLVVPSRFNSVVFSATMSSQTISAPEARRQVSHAEGEQPGPPTRAVFACWGGNAKPEAWERW